MRRGEIWLVGLDPTEGHEQKGRRPVLIVSPEAFNRATKVPIVLPITSGGKFARMAGFAVPLTGAGTKTTGVVRCGQPRALDLGAPHRFALHRSCLILSRWQSGILPLKCHKSNQRSKRITE